MRTEQQKENMRKHIAFLRRNANRIRKNFNMKELRKPECGTPACSLGWATISVGYPDNFCSGDDITGRVFGISDYSKNDPDKHWEYCFGGSWIDVNNTPEAAAARMEAVLYDQVPKFWDFSPEFSHPVVDTLKEVQITSLC